MKQIESKIRSARRRMVLAQFGQGLCVTLFAALLVATLAIALPAMRMVPVQFDTWVYAWIGGSALAGLLAAIAYAFAKAPSLESVAAEVDSRFGLRERLSSSMMLESGQRDTDFGIALLADAEKRADCLEMSDQFPLKPSRLGWLPVSIVPVLAVVLMLVEPISQSNASSTAKIDVSELKQVKTVASQLKKRLEQQKRKAEAAGLKEAQELFQKMEADLDKISQRSDLNRKEAMIAMNDLKKQLEERRDQLGSSEQMQRAMSQLKGLDSGPAEKAAKSIEKGDFGQAKEMVKQLASKMRDGALSDQEKQQLQKQIEKMQQALQDAADSHEQKKDDLKRQIEQARNEGRGAEAAQLQQQLNQMQQMDSQMQQMQQMAESLAQASDAMKQGDSSKASEALEEMAEQLNDMQQEMSELKDLESAMDELSQSKSQMRCQSCGGAGCKQCQGNGMQGGQNRMRGGNGQGDGLGKGSGFGDRPETEEDTNTYDTQVRGDAKKGKAIMAGFADGPNRKGITREDVKHAIQGSLSEESDPTENQTLPRTEREHAQQYFDRLREGK